jgi:hypothetical protein
MSQSFVCDLSLFKLQRLLLSLMHEFKSFFLQNVFVQLIFLMNLEVFCCNFLKLFP